MLLIIFLVCLSSNFLLIRSTENDTVIVTMNLGKNCTIQPSYTFTEDRNVSIVFKWDSQKYYINHGWLRLKGSVLAEFRESHKMLVKKSFEGTWMFEFLYLKDNNDYQRVNSNKSVLITYDGHNYTQSMCSTNVTIIEPPRSNHVKNLCQKYDSINANIEQLTKEVNTTKDQNIEINQTISSLSEQYETILNKLTTYKEQIHELEKKVYLLERNPGASMTELHNGIIKQHENENTLQIIDNNVVSRANTQSQHENEDILQNNVTGDVGKAIAQPTSESLENNKDLLQKIIIEFGKTLQQPISRTDFQEEPQSNHYPTTNLLLFSQSIFSPSMNDQKSTLRTGQLV